MCKYFEVSIKFFSRLPKTVLHTFARVQCRVSHCEDSYAFPMKRCFSFENFVHARQSKMWSVCLFPTLCQDIFFWTPNFENSKFFYMLKFFLRSQKRIQRSAIGTDNTILSVLPRHPFGSWNDMSFSKNVWHSSSHNMYEGIKGDLATSRCALNSWCGFAGGAQAASLSVFNTKLELISKYAGSSSKEVAARLWIVHACQKVMSFSAHYAHLLGTIARHVSSPFFSVRQCVICLDILVVPPTRSRSSLASREKSPLPQQSETIGSVVINWSDSHTCDNNYCKLSKSTDGSSFEKMNHVCSKACVRALLVQNPFLEQPSWWHSFPLRVLSRVSVLLCLLLPPAIFSSPYVVGISFENVPPRFFHHLIWMPMWLGCYSRFTFFVFLGWL